MGLKTMTRYVIDARVAIELVKRKVKMKGSDELLAPTLLRSQTLSILHESVARDELNEEAARSVLEGVGKLKVRLLGDAVLRRRAWEVASKLGWDSTYDAEYIALTLLQGDAFVTLDRDLARRAKGMVTVVSLRSIGAA
jgi:predicted nucleic acid-binding protein